MRACYQHLSWTVGAHLFLVNQLFELSDPILGFFPDRGSCVAHLLLCLILSCNELQLRLLRQAHFRSHATVCLLRTL